MKFTHPQDFVVEDCCNCGIQFAMTADFHNRRRKDHGWFYCPAGHQQHYVGKTEEQRLRAELDKAHRNADQFAQQAHKHRERADAIGRSYKRIRDRVKNGVCPCCERTFENLARHMQSKHPDFGSEKQLRTMRLAYGLTQTQLARECDVPAAYVSLYERGMELPMSGQAKLDEWIAEQSA